MLERIEPHLGREYPTFLTHGPAAQAALARLDPSDPSVAERFELFVCGIERANAFVELTDAAQQRARFLVESEGLHAFYGPDRAVDDDVLAALEFGMPPSSGSALGFDRLAVIGSGADRIGQVLRLPPADLLYHGLTMIRRGWSNGTMRWLWVVLLTGMVAGCTSAAAVRRSELEQWVGRPETELAAAMGAPNRTYKAGNMTFLTYEERRVTILPAGPGYLGPGPYWYGGFPPSATTQVCDTTFTVQRGVVRAFSFRGNACG